MPFCVNCGRDVSVSNSFCPSCGSPIHSSTSAPTTPPDPAGAPAPGEIPSEDWRSFLGPNSDFYLKRFPDFTVGNVTSFSVSWNWPAFLCSFWWFLYRKLYLHALAVFVVTMIPYLNLAAWIACPMAANYLYFLEGRKRIVALRAANGGTVPPETLARLGGVNRWVWAVAIIVTVLGLAVALTCLLVIGTALSCRSV